MKRILAALAVAVCTALTAPAADDAGAKQVTDQQFVARASASDLAEINLSNLALTRGKSEEVKKFAHHMVKDHTKASKELTQLADKLRIMPAQTADAKHEQIATRMAGLSGAQFDHAYMKQMVKDHEEGVALFKAESEHGQNAELKSLAKKLLPTLEKHLKMAKECCEKCEKEAKEK